MAPGWHILNAVELMRPHVRSRVSVALTIDVDVEADAIVDQIVLDPRKHLTLAPVTRQNDTTILVAYQGSGG